MVNRHIQHGHRKLLTEHSRNMVVFVLSHTHTTYIGHKALQRLVFGSTSFARKYWMFVETANTNHRISLSITLTNTVCNGMLSLLTIYVTYQANGIICDIWQQRSYSLFLFLYLAQTHTFRITIG